MTESSISEEALHSAKYTDNICKINIVFLTMIEKFRMNIKPQKSIFSIDVSFQYVDMQQRWCGLMATTL